MKNSSESQEKSSLKSSIKSSKLNKVEKSKRIIKYILMGFIILVAVRYIPNQPIQTKEIIMIGLISSIAFAMLDMVSPSIKVLN